MKKKILFWITLDLTQFSVAYNLQKNDDFELYAIIDVPNNAQKFFEEQTLVNFKQIWFFHDHIKTDKIPDLKYLSTFENKYELNLWKLAINERIFYRFYDFHKFSRNEILSIIEHACKLFEKVLDIKPNYLISKDPGFHHLEIFSNMCQKNGIEVLIPFVPKIGYKTMISRDPNVLDSKEFLNDIKSKQRSFEELRDFIENRKTSSQIKNVIDNLAKSRSGFIRSALKYLFSSNKSEKNRYTYFGRTKFKVISYMLKTKLEEKSRKKFIDENFIRSPKKDSSIIYFPMGVDLERNILIGAPFFTNQIEIIRSVAKSIPINYKLWVKEAPAQATRSWRSVQEYKEIMNLPNVVMIHPETSNKKMLEECSLVVTIAGSSGFEAAFYEKPSIIFSDTIYSKLSCVSRVSNLEKLPEIIDNALKIKVNSDEIDKFLTLIENNSFEFDWHGFNILQTNTFFYDGHLLDTEIDEYTARKFLKEHDQIVENISNQFMNKIIH